MLGEGFCFKRWSGKNPGTHPLEAFGICPLDLMAERKCYKYRQRTQVTATNHLLWERLNPK